MRSQGRRPHLPRCVGTSLLLFLLGLSDASAGTPEAGRSDQPGPAIAQQLVARHCTSCHLAPDPSDLPREDWPTALHWMGHYVGLTAAALPDLSVTELESYAPYIFLYALTDATGQQRRMLVFRPFMRDTPLMTPEEYAQVRQYFVANASTRSEMTIQRGRNPVLESFTPFYPATGIPPNSFIPSLLVDDARKLLYVGRGSNPPARRTLAPGQAPSGTSDEVHAFDLAGNRPLDKLTVMTVPLSLEARPSGLRIGTHGVFPVNMEYGWGQVLDWIRDDTRAVQPRMLLNGYHRLTHHQTSDLDADGLEDLVVSGMGDGILEFGGGRVSIFWQTPARTTQHPPEETVDETVLINRAGMIDFEIADFNGDGKHDIMLLTAQAQHQVLLFINEGNRRFTMQVIMERSPSFGGISIDVADFNHDGRPDLLVTNGNNVELVVQRPYHGLRVFENRGDLRFVERHFYPMHGATRAVVRDFDNDGNLDIAAVALFPDWGMVEPETFVYLAGKGDWEFEARSLDVPHWAPWASIAAGDVNGDGRPDIVLGLGNYFFSSPPDWTTRPIMRGRDPTAVPAVMFLINES